MNNDKRTKRLQDMQSSLDKIQNSVQSCTEILDNFHLKENLCKKSFENQSKKYYLEMVLISSVGFSNTVIIENLSFVDVCLRVLQSLSLICNELEYLVIKSRAGDRFVYERDTEFYCTNKDMLEDFESLIPRSFDYKYRVVSTAEINGLQTESIIQNVISAEDIGNNFIISNDGFEIYYEDELILLKEFGDDSFEGYIFKTDLEKSQLFGLSLLINEYPELLQVTPNKILKKFKKAGLKFRYNYEILNYLDSVSESHYELVNEILYKTITSSVSSQNQKERCKKLIHRFDTDYYNYLKNLIEVIEEENTAYEFKNNSIVQVFSILESFDIVCEGFTQKCIDNNVTASMAINTMKYILSLEPSEIKCLDLDYLLKKWIVPK